MTPAAREKMRKAMIAARRFVESEYNGSNESQQCADALEAKAAIDSFCDEIGRDRRIGEMEEAFERVFQKRERGHG